jgi:hypothetical protein
MRKNILYTIAMSCITVVSLHSSDKERSYDWRKVAGAASAVSLTAGLLYAHQNPEFLQNVPWQDALRAIRATASNITPYLPSLTDAAIFSSIGIGTSIILSRYNKQLPTIDPIVAATVAAAGVYGFAVVAAQNPDSSLGLNVGDTGRTVAQGITRLVNGTFQSAALTGGLWYPTALAHELGHWCFHDKGAKFVLHPNNDDNPVFDSRWLRVDQWKPASGIIAGVVLPKTKLSGQIPMLKPENAGYFGLTSPEGHKLMSEKPLLYYRVQTMLAAGPVAGFAATMLAYAYTHNYFATTAMGTIGAALSFGFIAGDHLCNLIPVAINVPTDKIKAADNPANYKKGYQLLDGAYMRVLYRGYHGKLTYPITLQACACASLDGGVCENCAAHKWEREAVKDINNNPEKLFGSTAERDGHAILIGSYLLPLGIMAALRYYGAK